jgi:hypothetical protein
MILVRISLEYKGIPFEIEINGQDLSSLDSLKTLLEQIKTFIDKMLEAKA